MMPKRGYKQSQEHKSKLKKFLKPFKNGGIPHNKGRSKYGISKSDHLKRYSQNHSLLRKYKINIGVYEEMVKKQDNRCAICGSYQIKGRSLSVDHNHITGRIRGLLCISCNAGIGYMKDNEQILKNAIDYLNLFNE